MREASLIPDGAVNHRSLLNKLGHSAHSHRCVFCNVLAEHLMEPLSEPVILALSTPPRAAVRGPFGVDGRIAPTCVRVLAVRQDWRARIERIGKAQAHGSGCMLALSHRRLTV